MQDEQEQQPEDVRVLDPQGHSATGAWWRGRLSAVDGFMLGTPT
jgi:hypothetical protein